MKPIFSALLLTGFVFTAPAVIAGPTLTELDHIKIGVPELGSKYHSQWFNKTQTEGYEAAGRWLKNQYIKDGTYTHEQLGCEFEVGC